MRQRAESRVAASQSAPRTARPAPGQPISGELIVRGCAATRTAPLPASQWSHCERGRSCTAAPPCWQHASDTPAQHRPHNAPPCMVARPSRACMGAGRLRGCLGQADAVTLPRHGSHRNARTHTISRVKNFLAAAAFVREGARERVGHPLPVLRPCLWALPAAGPDPRGPV